ncbi:RNA-directed DNA polymerase [Clavibacter sp. A6099]|uniref:RNA-directed DNA polymerase n=1 Tax=Clavibacter seminis TaxID=2860285 RepID=A0ABY3TC48_9MICO|nr:RNA-directed DNA polymerase [Clavibacter sp. A6099]
MNDDGPHARVGSTHLQSLLAIILGRSVSYPSGANEGDRVTLEKSGDIARISTVPFQYTVRHRSNDYRTLTIPHPAAQLDIVDFYRQHSDLILYHTNKSNYTLRRPTRVARYSNTRDWLFESKLTKELGTVEEDNKESDWIRSYFTYKQYSNIYKFYDSAEYRACERQYGYLVKVDIAKCFDSIYTHSISWATEGHDAVKAALMHHRHALKKTFGDKFDTLMQRLNHNETSGITTGSEVSRIFSEVILQAVDVSVEADLLAAHLRQGIDYQILRYVDDYFIFLAKADDRERVIQILADHLRKYKLRLNAAKEQGEHTPWLSPLSIAKDRVRRLIHEHASLGDKDMKPGALPSPYIDTAALIVGYKAILMDTGVSHFDLANYALSRCERRMEALFRPALSIMQDDVGSDIGVGDSYSEEERSRHLQRVSNALVYLLDFSFFVYSGAPRMSPVVKLARIVSSALRFCRSLPVKFDDRERLELIIHRELSQQLTRTAEAAWPGPVTATLLDCMADLGPRYSDTQEQVATWCGFESKDTGYLPPKHMNALLLFSMMLYMRDTIKYKELADSCNDWIMLVQVKDQNDAERALVALNVVTCPWMSQLMKDNVLRSYGSPSGTRMTAGGDGEYWNVNWEGFDLYSALQGKRLYEVY